MSRAQKANETATSRESRVEDLKRREIDFPLQKGRMIVYVPGQRVPESELIPLGTPEAEGGEILEGNISLSGRIDYDVGNIMGGIFESRGAGKARVTLPRTEHATVIYGQVKMTDESGRVHVFREGDSYLMKRGTVIVWEQTCEILQKSVCNIRED